MCLPAGTWVLRQRHHLPFQVCLSCRVKLYLKVRRGWRRWFHRYKHWVLLEMTWIWFSEPSLVTPVSGDLIPSSGLCRHCTHLVHIKTSRHIFIIINKWGFY